MPVPQEVVNGVRVLANWSQQNGPGLALGNRVGNPDEAAADNDNDDDDSTTMMTVSDDNDDDHKRFPTSAPCSVLSSIPCPRQP